MRRHRKIAAGWAPSLPGGLSGWACYALRKTQLCLRVGIGASCKTPVLDAFACGQRGVYATWQMMSSGKLKVFSSLGDYSQEFSIYARDTEGTVISQRSFDWMPALSVYMSGPPASIGAFVAFSCLCHGDP
jgi:hypothetical protein